MMINTTPDHVNQELQQTVLDFAAKHITPIAFDIDQTNQFPRELWPLMGKLGLLGITVGKKYGGTERGYFAQLLVLEAISKASASIGLAYAAHANLCANQIFRLGNEAQKMKYLPKLNSGEWLGALAMSEKDAGCDVLSMKLHAEEKDNHFVLNGHKMWITNGTDADIIVVYAKTNPEAGPHGMSCFIVEKGFAGFHANPKLDKLGMRGCDTSELIFKNCIVPKENVLGKLNDGLNILMSGLDFERAVITGGPLGIMQACLEVMVPYAKTRHQFKKPLGDFQFIQNKLANAYTQFHAARAFAYETAILCDQKKITTEQAASSYLFASEAATHIALETIQCLGGNGYLNASPAGRLLRDAKLYEIGAGTTEIRRIVIARALMKGN
jgi:isovaleryl-CoA dehydrogenase